MRYSVSKSEWGIPQYINVATMKIPLENAQTTGKIFVTDAIAVEAYNMY